MRDFVVSFPGTERLLANLKSVVPGLRSRKIQMLPGCGHWTQQERPNEVSAALVELSENAADRGGMDLEQACRPRTRSLTLVTLRHLSSYLRSAEFLGESDEKPFRPADVAEPIRVFILDYFAYELRAARAEPFKRLVDVVHGEHDAEVA